MASKRKRGGGPGWVKDRTIKPAVRETIGRELGRWIGRYKMLHMAFLPRPRGLDVEGYVGGGLYKMGTTIIFTGGKWGERWGAEE